MTWTQHTERFKLAALAFAVVGMLHCAEFTEGEFECELAVTRLQECCPSLSVPWDFCVYDGHGCETYHEPAYGPDQSRCVQHASCQSIVDAGLCETPADLGVCR